MSRTAIPTGAPTGTSLHAKLHAGAATGLALAALLGAASAARAQNIGPGNVTPPVNVASGQTTIVGGTTVATTVSAANATNVTGGTLTVDPTDGPSPGAITFRTVAGTGLYANGGTIKVVAGSGADSVAVETRTGHGVLASGTASRVTIEDGATIRNTAGYSGVGTGLVAIGGTIEAKGVVISKTNASSSSGNGVVADFVSGNPALGGTIRLGGGSITTSNNQAISLGASGSASSVTVEAPIDVLSTAQLGKGIYMHDGGQVILPSGFTLTMRGKQATGVVVDNTGVTAGALDGLRVDLNQTGGVTGGGIGVLVANGGEASISGLTVDGDATGIGVQAKQGSVVSLVDPTISVGTTYNTSAQTLSATSSNIVTISPSINGSFPGTSQTVIAGLVVQNSSMSATGATIVVYPTSGTYPLASGVEVSSFRSSGDPFVAADLTLADSRITTRNDNGASYALNLKEDALAHVSGSTLETSGDDGEVISFTVYNDSERAPAAHLTDSKVVATDGATGIFSYNPSPGRAPSVTLSGLESVLTSEDVGVTAWGPFDLAVDGVGEVRGDKWLLLAYSSANQPRTPTVDFRATDSALFGDIGAGTNATIDLDLAGSTWTGGASDITNVTLDAGSTWFVTRDSNATGTVDNAGLVSFEPPDEDGFKELRTRDYVGQDGEVAVNTVLGDDDSPSDVLVLDEGLASGTTDLIVEQAGGEGALTTRNGILVVATENGGNTETDAFRLAGRLAAGAYVYSLHRGDPDPDTTGRWYLRSVYEEEPPTPPGPDPEPPTPPGPGPDPDPGPGPTPVPPPPDPEPEVGPPIPPAPPAPEEPPVGPIPPDPAPPTEPELPHYRQEVSLHAAMGPLASIYGRQIIDTLHQRVGMQEQLRYRTDLDDDKRVSGVWARLIGETGKRDGDPEGIYDGAPAFDYTFGALQLGADLYRHSNDDGTRDHAGLTFAVGQGTSSVDHHLPDRTIHAGDLDFDAYSLGAYWTRYGGERDWYLDGVVQATWYDFDVDSPYLGTTSTDGFGLGVSAEGGYPFLLENGWTVEPQAQLVYQSIDIDSMDDGAGETSFSDQDSLAGRVGAMLSRSWQSAAADADKPRLSTAWGRVDLWHEFLAEPEIEEGGVPFIADLRETWVEFGVGATAQFSRTGVFYGSVSYASTFDSDDRGFDGQAGVRWNW